MRFLKIEAKDWSLICVLDMDSMYNRLRFKKAYTSLKRINSDTYRFIN